MCGQSITPTVVATGEDAFQHGDEAEVSEVSFNQGLKPCTFNSVDLSYGFDHIIDILQVSTEECAESYLVINNVEVVAAAGRDGLFCGDHLNVATAATDSGTIEGILLYTH